MNWRPPTKSISDLGATRIRQKLGPRISELDLPSKLAFGRRELVLSVGRTGAMLTRLQTLSYADRNRLVKAIGAAETSFIDLFLDNVAQFSFTGIVNGLADDRRSFLAGMVGAAIADLVMEEFGFHWRANARELKLQPRSRKGPQTKKLPDFVYDPGSKMGFGPQEVVAVEAKGSISIRQATRSAIRRLSERAYREKVRPYIGGTGIGLNVASGFAVAFGAVPGQQVSTLSIATPQVLLTGAISSGVRAHSLSAAATYQMQQQPLRQEQELPQVQMPKLMPTSSIGQGGGRGGGGDRRREGERERPSGAVAFADYECAFQLCGAFSAAAVLGEIVFGRTPDAPAREEIGSQEFGVAEGGQFVMGMDDLDSEWPGNAMFAVYKPIAEQILKAAGASGEGPPPTIAVASVPAEVMDAVREAGGAVQGDGLALLPISYNSGQRSRWNFQKRDWA